MASVASPYGFRLVKQLGENVTNHGFNQYPIPSGYNTDLKTGDLVQLTGSAGTLAKMTGTTTGTPIGVFIGCSYTDAALGFVNRSIWPANTVASNAMGYVIDNPNAVFQVQASAAVNQNAIGTNAAVIQGAGNATLGVSGMNLNAATFAVTATLPLRVVGLVNEVGFSVPGDAFTDCLVKLNTHMFNTATGNAP